MVYVFNVCGLCYVLCYAGCVYGVLNVLCVHGECVVCVCGVIGVCVLCVCECVCVCEVSSRYFLPLEQKFLLFISAY